MKAINFVILMLLAYTGYAQGNAETANPPAVFLLQLNGKEYTLNEGEATNLDGNFNNPSVVVKMADYRKFDDGKISFRYKSNSAYKYTESVGAKTWTFAGDCTVLLFELDGNVKMDVIIESVMGQFGKENCKLEPASRLIGGKQIAGEKINVSLAGQKLVQEYYQLELNDGKTNILAFQNTGKDDGSVSEEGKEGLELVASSVKTGH